MLVYEPCVLERAFSDCHRFTLSELLGGAKLMHRRSLTRHFASDVGTASQMPCVFTAQ
mgnify:CR=1 FL=1